MLKVWRGKATIFAECTKCGSYGTVPHLQPKVRMEPEIEQALERHTAHMMALRSHFQKAAGEIARQVHNGSMSRDDGTKKIRELYENHVAQIRLGEALLPSPEGKVKEFVVGCPWCSVVEEVDVEQLPEGVDHPDFEQAKIVNAHVVSTMAAAKKGK